jgi:hypothetical protein
MYTEDTNITIEGHLKIWDDALGEDNGTVVDKRNAVNPENLSVALAKSLANGGATVYEIHFGNGGTVINDLGVITYNAPRVTSEAADLYSPTYYKVVDANDTVNNTDPTKNYIASQHLTGLNYTDIVVNAVLDYTEPDISSPFNLANASQDALDNAADFNGAFVFDEIGLKSKGEDVNTGLLLTHITFHPVQKSANRLFRVRYTLRIRVN